MLYLSVAFSTSLWVLDDVFKGQSSVKHHGLLTGYHLLVYGVVEVSHLKEGGERVRGGGERERERDRKREKEGGRGEREGVRGKREGRREGGEGRRGERERERDGVLENNEIENTTITVDLSYCKSITTIL